MRMHDSAGKDRETLLKAFSLLDDQAVRRDVSKDGGEKLRLDAAIAQWRALKDDTVKEEMRAVRDYESAHNIPSRASIRPCMSEFMRFSRETIKLVENIAAGTGVSLVSFDSTATDMAEQAAAYWKCLQRKEPAT